MQGSDKTEPVVKCRFCGAPRKYKRIEFMNVHITSLLLPCECPEGKAAFEREDAEKKAALLKEDEKRRKKQFQGIQAACGIPLRYREMRLDTLFVDNNNRAAIDKARWLTENFEKLLPGEDNPMPVKNGLYICGTVGTGKTCLAAAIANNVLEQGGSVRFITMTDLLAKLMDAMNCGESLMRIMNDYKRVQLLVIDDLGKEPPKEWGISKVFDILNSRCENCLPTIITTNYSNENIAKYMTPRGCTDHMLADSITDRIREMCCPVVLTGESRRGRVLPPENGRRPAARTGL